MEQHCKHRSVPYRRVTTLFMQAAQPLCSVCGLHQRYSCRLTFCHVDAHTREPRHLNAEHGMQPHSIFYAPPVGRKMVGSFPYITMLQRE